MKNTLIVVFALFAMLFAGNAYAQEATANVEGVSAAITQNSVGSDLSKGRGFAIPGEMIFPGTPGYYGEATPGHRFIPLNKLLMFNTLWDADKAAAMLKGRTGKKDVQIRYLMADKDTEPAKMVMCSIAMPQKVGATAVDQIAIGTVSATNKKAISADVLATAIVKASERGANYIMFMAEGVNREVDAHGWGIGFNTTQAQVYSGDTSKGNVSSAGMGYSRGWSGYIDYPWLQFTFLRVEGLADVPVVKPLPEKAAQTGNHTEAGSLQAWFKDTFTNPDGTVETATVEEYGQTSDVINGNG